MFHRSNRNLFGVTARNAVRYGSLLPGLLLAAVMSLPAVAQNTHQPSETGQQRANEGKGDKVTELDEQQACQDAHAIHPAPQHFAATTTPSSTPAGIVNLTWTPVAGLDPSVSYLIQYQMNGVTYYVSPRQPDNASSFVDSRLPVWYPLKFSISTVKEISVSVRSANGTTHVTHIRCQGPVAYSNPPVVVPTTSARLAGFVDLHTHPMANLGFGGKLLYGGVDASPNGGSLLPADPDCNHNIRATSEQQALGHDKSTHGGWDAFSNQCGDKIREQLVHLLQFGAYDTSGDASGYPSFSDWPRWNDITHQKMWVEWIRRAYNGGLRVMVALAVNNKTLGDLVSGPGDYPTDDKSSADLQIAEMKAFVGRHPDFMEIAYSSADVYRIVSNNKLAIILGVEIDHIGNLQVARAFGVPDPNPPDANTVRAEIDRLYSEGVRYIFPIHLLDNAFGGSAAYSSLFDVSTLRESGHAWDLVCATDRMDQVINSADRYGFTFDSITPKIVGLAKVLGKPNFPLTVSLTARSCPPGAGQKNRLGLTPSGVIAIKEMMHLGMLIDIDHMSQAAADQTLQMAAYAGYPVNSGHNAVRGSWQNHFERALRPDQYAIIGRLHGMAGVGSANVDASQWLLLYNQVIIAMGGGNIAAGFGTDTNGLELGMRPSVGADRVQYNSAFPASSDGNKTWYYYQDGVAHYGMLWDFVQDLRSLRSVAGFPVDGKAVVDNGLMSGADYLFHTWQIAETKGAQVR